MMTVEVAISNLHVDVQDAVDYELVGFGTPTRTRKKIASAVEVAESYGVRDARRIADAEVERLARVRGAEAELLREIVAELLELAAARGVTEGGGFSLPEPERALRSIVGFCRRAAEDLASSAAAPAVTSYARAAVAEAIGHAEAVMGKAPAQRLRAKMLPTRGFAG